MSGLLVDSIALKRRAEGEQIARGLEAKDISLLLSEAGAYQIGDSTFEGRPIESEPEDGRVVRPGTPAELVSRLAVSHVLDA